MGGFDLNTINSKNIKDKPFLPGNVHKNFRGLLKVKKIKSRNRHEKKL